MTSKTTPKLTLKTTPKTIKKISSFGTENRIIIHLKSYKNSTPKNVVLKMTCQKTTCQKRLIKKLSKMAYQKTDPQNRDAKNNQTNLILCITETTVLQSTPQKKLHKFDTKNCGSKK